MNAKRLRLLIFPAIIVVVVLVINLSKNKVEGITATDWVLKSHSYVENANSFLENFDNSLTLYFMGVTNEESFAIDYEVLKKQWKLVYSDYEDFKKKNDILPDTSTTTTQIAYETVEALYTSINELFAELDTINKSDKQYVSYVYLAHQQKIIKAYTKFTITYNLLNGEYDNLTNATTAPTTETTAN